MINQKMKMINQGKMLRFKITQFRSFISNINSTLLDIVEDPDIVMAICNLLEYGHNYFMTSASL